VKKILICDDEESILSMVSLFLKREGYNVITAEDGKTAIEKLEKENPDLLILDVMLPDISGFDILKIIAPKYKIPTIMLTAKSDIVDKVLGLEFGADDYITKPFDMRELSARIKALIRRMDDAEEKREKPFSYKDLEIDFDKKVVKRSGKVLNLTVKEFQLLKFLASSKGRVVTREEILDKVWGYDYFGDTRTVDVHIVRLRKKVEVDPSNSEYINTVFGFGYKFGE
jgi:two-component system alkaline phosphatase synthesis response regulator PhoP/two-component system response regulator VicR